MINLKTTCFCDIQGLCLSVFLRVFYLAPFIPVRRSTAVVVDTRFEFLRKPIDVDYSLEVQRRECRLGI